MGYKLKLKPGGEIAKSKAMLVAKGFLQRSTVDFNEVYAHVVRVETIRLIMVIADYKGRKMHQLDVKFIFFNKPLEEGVYMK